VLVQDDELAESEDGFAVEPPFLCQAGERCAGKPPKFLKVPEVLLLHGDLLLEPLGVGLKFLE
jgi:hypothetical protein